MNTPQVSVIIPVYNEGPTLNACIDSILKNDYQDFEIFLVDDASTDNSAEVISTYIDRRVKLLRRTVRAGPAAARNMGIANATSEFLFFTDADCVVGQTWILEGMKCFLGGNTEAVIGVEGNVRYRATSLCFRHKVPVNPFYPRPAPGIMNSPGRDFGCGNIAYRKTALQAIGGFDERRYVSGREDSDAGWRIKSQGEIIHRPEMEVLHKESFWTPRKLVTSARRYAKDVLFFKDHGFFFFQNGRILHPKLLGWMFFPFAIFREFKFNSIADYLFVVPFWAYLVMLRLVIWREAIRQRVVVI